MTFYDKNASHKCFCSNVFLWFVFKLTRLQTANEDLISWFSGQFFAHTHKDDFRLQTIPLDISVGQQDLGKSFVLIAPAISPVYHNNPAFRLLSLDTEKLLIMDYTQYYMDIVMATGKIIYCN